MRILILSHVDRRWIKQRPHFMAEELSRAGFTVTFAYARAFSRRTLVSGDLDCPNIPIVVAPNRLRARRIWRWADIVLQNFWAAGLALLRRPDVVWLTSPRLGACARSIVRLTGARLVYDYMDRNALFDGTTAAVAREERDLLSTSDLVLCSSSVLAADVREEFPWVRQLLVRNALGDPQAWTVVPLDRESRGNQEVRLGYAGTVSSWFDSALVSRALEREPTWRISVWGPCDVELPSVPGLAWEGILPHKDLPGAFAGCDVLVMPFRLTPLIEAVDPVKAYEYVATGLPVVVPRYSETEHFEPYAKRYTPGDVDDFVRAVKEALGVRDGSSVLEFARRNTWKVRVAQVASELERLS